MTPAAAAQRWADTWRTAWEALQPGPIVALYADDVVFSSQPFRTPYRGKQGVAKYVIRAFAAEQRPVVRFGAPVVDGNRAAVSWWSQVTEDGEATTLAGTSMLHFDAAGLVTYQWDTWNHAPQRIAPPAWVAL